MRLLVTGGAGYIGGFTTRMLRAAGHEVTVVDNLTTGHPSAAGDAKLVVADFGDFETVAGLLREGRIEAVLHFAGLKSVPASLLEPERYFEVNVTQTSSLLEAMADADVGMLVYSGTCAVYGTPGRFPVDESQDPAPLNPYGETKLLAERRIEAAHRQSGIRFCTLRYFNAGGAALDGSFGEDPGQATGLVPVVIKAALGQLPHVPVYGTDYPTPDGTAVRDYIHVLDLAIAHQRALEYLVDGGQSEVLNLGTGHGTSVREVIAAAERVAGHSIPVQEEGRRAGDPPAIWADSSRANRLLSWHPTYGIDDIVETAWRWQAGRVGPAAGTKG
jgi:UDP-glucose-4-epimerase GalE